MLRNTVMITALLLAMLATNLVAQGDAVRIGRIGVISPTALAPKLDIVGAAANSGDKAFVLGGSSITLAVKSELAESYVAFVYQDRAGWTAFALDITDRKGLLRHTVEVPTFMVSGSLRVRAVVRDRAGRATPTNSFLVTFGEGDDLLRKGKCPRCHRRHKDGPCKKPPKDGYPCPAPWWE